MTADLDRPWVMDAACIDYGRPDVWFDPSGEHEPKHRIKPDLAAAVAICRACPVQLECARHALETGERFGVWGGLTPHDREVLRRKEGGACTTAG